MAKTFKPGESAPKSGLYGITGTKEERTVVKGEPFPPTPKKGETYVMNEPARHKSKK